MPGKGGDRRFMRVVLTTEGRTVRECVIAAHAEWVHRRFAALTPDQLDQLETLLRAVIANSQIDPRQAADECIALAGPSSTDARA